MFLYLTYPGFLFIFFIFLVLIVLLIPLIIISVRVLGLVRFFVPLPLDRGWCW